MFVKIKYYNAEIGISTNAEGIKQTRHINKSTLNSEVIYECASVQFIPDTRPSPENENVSEPIQTIVLDMGTHTIEIPTESRKQCFEIFLMNDQGKTIDRYAY